MALEKSAYKERQFLAVIGDEVSSLETSLREEKAESADLEGVLLDRTP